MKILDVGSSDGSWVLMQALEKPGNIYINLDIEQDEYKINSPERAYRFLVGQAINRAQKRLGMDPNDKKTGGAIFYLGQDFQTYRENHDEKALGILGQYEDGKTLLDSETDIPFGDDLEMNGKKIRELLQGEMPETTRRVLAERMRNIHHVVGDLKQLPFPEQSFSYVRSRGTVGNYSSDPALMEAQRVLKDGTVKRSIDGIETEVNDYRIESLRNVTIALLVIESALEEFSKDIVYRATVTGFRKMASDYREKFPLVSAEYIKKAAALEAGKRIKYHGITIPIE